MKGRTHIMSNKGIVLLGLGPGDPQCLTREAWDWLAQIDEIYLRTNLHPAVVALPVQLQRLSFDFLYQEQAELEQVFEEIINKVLELGQRPGGVTYAVPGHPFVAEETCPEIARRAHAHGIPLRVIEGLSFLEPIFRALSLDPFPQLTLIDALKIDQLQVPSFACSQPVLIGQIYNRMLASNIKLTLMSIYPDEHPVRLVHAAGMPEQRIEDLPLHAIDQSPHLGFLSSLYLPPLPYGHAFEDFQEIVARLRAPGGCPWDQEQTHDSLKPYLLEEAYEALEALDNQDMQALQEELGDLLLQIALHAQIAVDECEFNMADVLQTISQKLIRRHPHVFAEAKVDGIEDILHNWEQIKASERKENGTPGKKGMLDGIPLALPALTQADAIQRRAQRVGFDWPEIEGVIKKVYEELDELRAANDDAERQSEAGDLLFAAVNVIRWLGVDPEAALRETNRRFKVRFAYIEAAAEKRGISLDEMSFEEMDALWEESKDKLAQ